MKLDNIDWKTYIEPQLDGSDVKIAHKILKENFGYTPHKIKKGDPSIFDGKVGVNEYTTKDLNLRSYDISGLEEDFKKTLSVWPEGYKFVSEFMDYYTPAIIEREGGMGLGCSCGLYGKKPWESSDGEINIVSTANSIVGAVEGMVHELGHHKIHALGINLVDYDKTLIANDEEELYNSPVRFDIKRPMSAVFHAEFSYTYVTEFYTHFIDYLVENDLDIYLNHKPHEYFQKNSYNLKRIGNGIWTLREHFKGTDEGNIFMEHYLNYVTRVWREGYEQALKYYKDGDFMPVNGNPL